MQTLSKELTNHMRRIAPTKGLVRKILLFLDSKPSDKATIRKDFQAYSVTSINNAVAELLNKHIIEVKDGKYHVVY